MEEKKTKILQKVLTKTQQRLYFIQLNQLNKARAVLEETLLDIMDELGIDRTWKITADASRFVKAEVIPKSAKKPAPPPGHIIKENEKPEPDAGEEA